jgi:hypothetical protein
MAFVSRSLTIVCILNALLGCSSSSGPALGAQPQAQPPDSVVFDVQWKPSTVVLSDADVAGSLTSPTPSAGILHFAHATEAVKKLVVDTRVVVPGAGLFRVTSSALIDGGVALGVVPASLLDAADSGHVAWDIGAHHVGKTVVGVNALALQSTVSQALETPVSFSGPVGNYNVALTLTPNADQTDLALTATHTPFPGGSLEVGLQGHVGAFRSQGDFQFGGGSVQSFTYGVHGYRADLTVRYQFAAIKGSADMSIPLSMSWPFLVGPIPMYVSLGVELGLQSTLAQANDLGSGTAHFVYTGEFGVSRSGVSFQPTGGLSNYDFSLADATQASAVTAGVEVLLDAPKISVGVGVPAGSAVFDANLFFKVKSEIVSNLTIPDLLAPGKPSCLQVSCNAGAYYGGSLTLFGAQIDHESTISAVNREVAKSGSACP